MKLISPKHVGIVVASADTQSSANIQAPEISAAGQLRFCTVTQVNEHSVVDGATTLNVGDLVVLKTMTGEDPHPGFAKLDEILGFWRPFHGRYTIEPVGDRVIVETGFFASSDGDFGIEGSALAGSRRAAGIATEQKLGETCTLTAVSRGVATVRGADVYERLLKGVGHPCQIGYDTISTECMRTPAERAKGLALGCLADQVVLPLDGGRLFILTPVRWLFSVTHDVVSSN